MNHPRSPGHSFAGLVAVAMWATNIAFSKSIMEKEGIYNTAIYIYFYSGIANTLLLILLLGKGIFQKLKSLSWGYFMKCGIFFILSNSLLIIAIGMVSATEELVIISILNYTWPILIYVFKIPILKSPFRPVILFAGIALSLAGIILASLQGQEIHEFQKLFASGQKNYLAYLLAFLNSVSWALYSNLTAKYKTRDDIAGIPVVFFLISLVFIMLQFRAGKLPTVKLISALSNGELIYQIIGPTTLGYLFWYLGIKHGNKNLITSVSFFIPLFSALIIAMKFRVPVETAIWLAILLLIAGSYLSYRSFQLNIINSNDQ
jgi:drug/metabolite transporter (DMT)-like permease